MKFSEFRNRQQKEVNDFKPIFFAFNQEQYVIGLKEVNGVEVVAIGGGGYVAKTEYPRLLSLHKRHATELEEFLKVREQLIDALIYELGNHEYCITYDGTDTLEALGLTNVDTIIYNEAVATYLRSFE